MNVIVGNGRGQDERTRAPQERDSRRRGRARLNAWLLALLAGGFYIGFIVLSLVKGLIGGG